MKNFFEKYIYYHSVYFKKVFPKWDGWQSHSIMSLTGCQTLLIVNLTFIFIYGPFNIKRKLNIIEIFIFLAIFFALDYYNNKLYAGRFTEFNDRWKNEQRREKIFSISKIIFFITISWGLIFINGWLFNRYR